MTHASNLSTPVQIQQQNQEGGPTVGYLLGKLHQHQWMTSSKTVGIGQTVTQWIPVTHIPRFLPRSLWNQWLPVIVVASGDFGMGKILFLSTFHQNARNAQVLVQSLRS